MMDAAREWLLGVTAAAILAALAEGLMQEGGPKRVGRLVCGLVLLAAVFRPAAELTLPAEGRAVRVFGPDRGTGGPAEDRYK